MWEDRQVPVTQTVNGQPVETYGTRKILWQYSNLDPNKRWEVPQTVDTVDPTSPMYNARSAYAKTLHRDGVTWGDVPADTQDRHVKLAHNNEAITCQVCHSSWATSCFGCHLPMKANMRVPLNKFEGITDRNFTTYNPQVVRDDVFMLGIDGTVKNHRMAVLRSSSAVVVSSQNANREWSYSQQQTVSAEGYSGQAFNPHFPHTTSGVGTTKGCTDCHMSAQRDNNAWMTQLLGFGTGTVNFFGRYAWVGAGKEGIRSVVWTEPEEPQAAIGSHLHKLAYPKELRGTSSPGGGKLGTVYEHRCHRLPRPDAARGVPLHRQRQRRVPGVRHRATSTTKRFSERFNTSPVSPHRSRTCTSRPEGIATVPRAPEHPRPRPDCGTHLPENEETPIPLYYGSIYGTDTVEGLVESSGWPRSSTGQPDKSGFCTRTQRSIRMACSMVRRDVRSRRRRAPLHHESAGPVGGQTWNTRMQARSSRAITAASALKNPRAVAIQFQYAFVTDDEGLKIFSLADPDHPAPISGARVPLADAHRLYLARTYCYVADGRDGLAIIDIERPEHPHVAEMYTADGRLDDVQDVKIGSVSQSMFALVADGKKRLPRHPDDLAGERARERGVQPEARAS